MFILLDFLLSDAETACNLQTIITTHTLFPPLQVWSPLLNLLALNCFHPGKRSLLCWLEITQLGRVPSSTGGFFSFKSSFWMQKIALKMYHNNGLLAIMQLTHASQASILAQFWMWFKALNVIYNTPGQPTVASVGYFVQGFILVKLDQSLFPPTLPRWLTVCLRLLFSSSSIRYVEEHIQRTGVAIETQGFSFVTSGRKRESLTVSPAVEK